MEKQFENRYFPNDKMLLEYINKVICKNQKIMFTVLSVLAYAEIAVVSYRGIYLKIVWLALLGVILLALLAGVFLNPVFVLRQVKENAKRLHNGRECESAISFGNNIALSEGTVSFTIEYSQIIKIHQLKHSYVLMFGKRTAI